MSCVIAFCVATCGQGIASAGGRKAPLGGINIPGASLSASFARIEGEIATARQLHAKLVRVAIPWALFEPAQGQISNAMANVVNRIVTDASASHIGVIALVDQTPCWASTAPASELSACTQRGLSAANAWPPRQASEFGSFVGLLAQRYGSGLTAIEVWNEPDQSNQLYLAGTEKPRHYAELLKAAYPAVKSVDPSIKVLAGSLVGANGAFMQALYKQGIKGYYDGVSVHFYNLVLASVRRFREVQLENHDTTPLWLDEFGWTSCWPAHATEQEQACVTPKVQAQNVTNAYRELASTPYVAAMLPYGLRDVRGEEFGVFSTTGMRKPSFYALSSALESPFGSPSAVTLRLSVRKGRVIASGAGPVGDYMKLEVLRHHALAYWAIFTLNRFNEYSLTLPAKLGSKGLTVRVYQYWRAAQDAQRSI